MGYERMDHAGWIENHNRATNLRNASSRSKIAKPILPEVLTEFQAKVVDILGMAGGGIYNAPIALNSIKWDYGYRGVSVIWRGGRDMATWDSSALTVLVFLCHAARIRCAIDPAGPHMLRISFWPRRASGGIGERHPNLEEAVAAFQGWLPADHRVRFKEIGDRWQVNKT